jgi:hypothetical protein
MLLPVSGFIKNMILMPANTFTTEDSWEAKAFGNKLLRHAYVVLWFRLTDDKLSNL